LRVGRRVWANENVKVGAASARGRRTIVHAGDRDGLWRVPVASRNVRLAGETVAEFVSFDEIRNRAHCRGRFGIERNP